jgi:hypothetical protein
MLRVETTDSAQGVKLKFEGQFKGDDAQNTRALVTCCPEGMALVVDLTEVTFIDSLGEAVLSFFGRCGAQFIAETSYALDVCERLHLRLVWGGASGADLSGTSRANARRHRASRKT